jgi:hypothetical protein
MGFPFVSEKKSCRMRLVCQFFDADADRFPPAITTWLELAVAIANGVRIDDFAKQLVSFFAGLVLIGSFDHFAKIIGGFWSLGGAMARLL